MYRTKGQKKAKTRQTTDLLRWQVSDYKTPRGYSRRPIVLGDLLAQFDLTATPRRLLWSWKPFGY